MPDPDTRRPMTRAQFEQAAREAYDGWWLTGEESFIHVPSVMQVEGWNLYGHPGNRLLTEPQRVLMMWSDLVGQVSNGGFTQFIDNFRASLGLAYALVGKLGWSEMFDRFDRAFREQAGDPANPVVRQDSWPAFDPVSIDREAIIRQLAGRDTRWKPWARARAAASYGRFSDLILKGMYEEAVERGEIAPDPALSAQVPDFDEDPIPVEAAEAFDDWFYADETKAASKVHVGDYILRNRDGLCRLTD